jgi:hypothetical protein
MHALFKVQDDFLYKSKKQWSGWCFAANKLLAKLSRRSEATIKRARQRMAFMGLIQYRLGQFNGRKATEYRVLIDRFYLADRALFKLRRGSKRGHTKAISN